MNHGNLKVHIGELVVTGQRVADRAALGAAVRSELTRLLAQRQGDVATVARDRVNAGTIGATHSTQALGRRVARAACNVIRGRT